MKESVHSLRLTLQGRGGWERRAGGKRRKRAILLLAWSLPSCCCQSNPIGHSGIHSNISWAPRRCRGNVRWRKASVYPLNNPVIRPSGNLVHLWVLCVSVSEVSLFTGAPSFSNPQCQHRRVSAGVRRKEQRTLSPSSPSWATGLRGAERAFPPA